MFLKNCVYKMLKLLLLRLQKYILESPNTIENILTKIIVNSF